MGPQFLRPVGANPPSPVFTCASSVAVLQHLETVIDPRSLLSPAELARSGALVRPRDRDDFIAARALIRLLLLQSRAPHAGLASLTDVVLTQHCPQCGGPHGRPVVDVPGLAVSWAHSDGYVAAAVARGSVGVDVEPGDTASEPRASTTTTMTTRSWVRSEAIIKWGHGGVDEALGWQSHLSGRPFPRGRRYSLSIDGAPRPARLPRRRQGGSVVLTDAPEDACAAVCSVAAASHARWVDVLPP